MYRSLSHKVTCEINFERNTVIPSMAGVSAAYLGLLPCKEFLRLIMDDDGDMRPNLFYNNVRDFQGDTPVNKEIAEALCDPSVSPKFVLLNNGVTVVTRSVTRFGDKFILNDFQIVNGCQTSNVLFQNRDRIADSTYLPVKLIVTDDSEVTNRIIRATNRQTEVKPEAFESLAPFHRTLEDFYNAMARDVKPRLYYERRSKQYIHESVRQHQVVSLAGQCLAFLAMFCEEPHSTPSYYGAILRSSRSRLFRDDHQPFPYYVAALALNRIELLFNEGILDRRFREYKYHVLLLVRISVIGNKLPPMNSKKIDSHCKRLLDCVLNEAEFRRQVEKACQRIDSCLRTFGPGRDGNRPSRLREFTQRLIPEAAKKRPQGNVVYFDTGRGFGFIRCAESDSDVFVHFTSVRESLNRYLNTGDVVEFDIVETIKGKQAENVVVLTRSQVTSGYAKAEADNP